MQKVDKNCQFFLVFEFVHLIKVKTVSFCIVVGMCIGVHYIGLDVRPTSYNRPTVR